MTDEKINALLRSVESLKQTQAEKLDKMTQKLSKLETDVVASRDDVVQRVAKRKKWEKTLEIQKKRHKKQFLFNEDVKD